jgi:hypothetical protein
MQTQITQLSDVTYNAASRCFEALVTLHDAGQPRRYACAIAAPITTPFAVAAKGLITQALRQHRAGSAPSSQFAGQTARPRAGRPAFDPARWLQSVLDRLGRDAA